MLLNSSGAQRKKLPPYFMKPTYHWYQNFIEITHMHHAPHTSIAPPHTHTHTHTLLTLHTVHIPAHHTHTVQTYHICTPHTIHTHTHFILYTNTNVLPTHTLCTRTPPTHYTSHTTQTHIIPTPLMSPPHIHQGILTFKHDVKILIKILTNRIQQSIKKIHCDIVGLISG